MQTDWRPVPVLMVALFGTVSCFFGYLFLSAGLDRIPLVTGALLTMLWPLVRKHLNPNLTKTNVDAVIGTSGLVTVAIDNVEAHGQVKLGAMEWTARSASGEVIPAGTLVKVDKIEGVKAFVSPVTEKAEV